jgi:hypothetical protein
MIPRPVIRLSCTLGYKDENYVSSVCSWSGAGEVIRVGKFNLKKKLKCPGVVETWHGDTYGAKENE